MNYLMAPLACLTHDSIPFRNLRLLFYTIHYRNIRTIHYGLHSPPSSNKTQTYKNTPNHTSRSALLIQATHPEQNRRLNPTQQAQTNTHPQTRINLKQPPNRIYTLHPDPPHKQANPQRLPKHHNQSKPNHPLT